MATLALAGVPVGVSISPIIPGLSEADMADTLVQAVDAGATWAGADLVALQGSVAAVFERRLRRTLPARADTVLARIQRAWGGTLELPRTHRPRHDDPAWQATFRMFELQRKRVGLGSQPPAVRSVVERQIGLFGQP
jgi:DNA repair photolyase